MNTRISYGEFILVQQIVGQRCYSKESAGLNSLVATKNEADFPRQKIIWNFCENICRFRTVEKLL